MERFFVASAIMMATFQAKAETLVVEFTWCTNNPNYLCALVSGVDGSVEEIGVDAAPEISNDIIATIGSWGRSLAMNIDGRIPKANGFGGSQYKKLYVNSLTTSNSPSRPR